MTRWFEDVPLHQAVELGSHTFTEDAIVAFAQDFDPLAHHTSAEGAHASGFGGLVASEWHTAVIGHRKMVDRLFAEEDIVRAEGGTPGVTGPSPGGDVMVFPHPVRPGDTVSYVLTVTGKRTSRSVKGWGLLFNTMEGTNQEGAVVYHSEFAGFSKLRDYRAPLVERLSAPLLRLVARGRR